MALSRHHCYRRCTMAIALLAVTVNGTVLANHREHTDMDPNNPQWGGVSTAIKMLLAHQQRPGRVLKGKKGGKTKSKKGGKSKSGKSERSSKSGRAPPPRPTPKSTSSGSQPTKPSSKFTPTAPSSKLGRPQDSSDSDDSSPDSIDKSLSSKSTKKSKKKGGKSKDNSSADLSSDDSMSASSKKSSKKSTKGSKSDDSTSASSKKSTKGSKSKEPSKSSKSKKSVKSKASKSQPKSGNSEKSDKSKSSKSKSKSKSNSWDEEWEEFIEDSGGHDVERTASPSPQPSKVPLPPTDTPTMSQTIAPSDNPTMFQTPNWEELLTICRCNERNLCVDNIPLAQGIGLRMCFLSNDDTIQALEVNDLQLEKDQPSRDEDLVVVVVEDDGQVVGFENQAVKTCDRNTCVVTAPMPDQFFEEERRSTILARGRVSVEQLSLQRIGDGRILRGSGRSLAGALVVDFEKPVELDAATQIDSNLDNPEDEDPIIGGLSTEDNSHRGRRLGLGLGVIGLVALVGGVLLAQFRKEKGLVEV